MTGVYTAEEPVVARRGELRYRSADGTEWRIEVRLPGASSAMVVFLHPHSSRLNRYAWQIWRGPEARSVTSRVTVDRVAASLTDADIARLYSRSMPVSADRSLVNPGVAAQSVDGRR